MARIGSLSAVTTVRVQTQQKPEIKFLPVGNDNKKIDNKRGCDDSIWIAGGKPLQKSASIGDDIKKDIYGFFGSARRLHENLIVALKAGVDEEKVDMFGDPFSEEDNKRVKAEIDKYDGLLFHGQITAGETYSWGNDVDFARLSKSIARIQNRYLKENFGVTKDVFGSRDFIPSEQDFFKDRVVKGLVTRDCILMSETDKSTQYKWLTMWEYIHRTYDRVAARMLPVISEARAVSSSKAIKR
jgi:hypothetical protein